MNKFYSGILLLIGLITVSCNHSKVTTESAIKFYDSINYQVNLTYRLQQKFIDEITLCISQVMVDKIALVDTFKLYRDLDSAKISNIYRLKMIKDINEIDSNINYKKIIINNAKLFANHYNNEFNKCIKVLGSNQQNRFETCRNLMLPALNALKESSNEVQKAKIEFKTKYNFKTPPE